ncbi:MAG: M12 family metallo-peptidase [Steroidobacter sp.]
MRISWLLAVVVTAAAVPCVAAAQDARILYFEPLRSFTPDRDSVLRKSAAPQLRELGFDAFGRRFEMSLDTNHALINQLQSKSTASSLQLYRGRLKNASDSWVRIAVKNGAVQGMFWDGADLYVIEPAAQIRDSLVAPLDAGAAETIIFRLADVSIASSEASCAVEAADDARQGSQEYESLVRELKTAPAVMQAAGADVRLQLSAMGDAPFLQRYANQQDARDAILMRLNNVDGIFSSQLGVEIEVSAVFVNDANSDPLSDATSANTLLQELGKVRKRSSGLLSSGLTHLFTGRDLDGTTVGIAYLNKLCHAEYGVGLTEVRAQNSWRDSLIAAHEIGHNFGASHDGDSAGACAAAPTGAYLMSSSVSGSDQFSQCSLDVMRPKVQSASCIARLPGADISLAADLGDVREAVSQPFEWALDISNIGGVAAERVRVEILVPPAVMVDDAYVIGGSCTSGAGVIFCQLGDVPGGAMRAVNLTLRSDVVGSNSISGRAASDNDAALGNNDGDGALIIEPEADLGVTLQAPAAAVVGGAFNVEFLMTNRAAIDAADLVIGIDLPPGVAVSNAVLSNGSCSVAAATVQCMLSSLSAGGSAAGALSMTPASSGTATVRARVSGAYVDPHPANDAVEHTINVAAAPVVVQSASTDSGSSGSGGGGAASILLFALAGLRLLRRPAPPFRS